MLFNVENFTILLSNCLRWITTDEVKDRIEFAVDGIALGFISFN
jgi:hypothetical protein